MQISTSLANTAILQPNTSMKQIQRLFYCKCSLMTRLFRAFPLPLPAQQPTFDPDTRTCGPCRGVLWLVRHTRFPLHAHMSWCGSAAARKLLPACAGLFSAYGFVCFKSVDIFGWCWCALLCRLVLMNITCPVIAKSHIFPGETLEISKTHEWHSSPSVSVLEYHPVLRAYFPLLDFCCQTYFMEAIKARPSAEEVKGFNGADMFDYLLPASVSVERAAVQNCNLLKSFYKAQVFHSRACR